jgi:hypothetical protein
MQKRSMIGLIFDNMKPILFRVLAFSWYVTRLLIKFVYLGGGGGGGGEEREGEREREKETPQMGRKYDAMKIGLV